MQTTYNLVTTHLLKAFPKAISIYAFGSRVTGTAKPDSDLDLAILVAGYADPLALWEAANQLAVKLNYDVDLLDLRAANTVMQHQIITTGKRLYGDSLDAQLYELFILKEKFYLEDLRAEQLKDIAKEGKIYA